MFPPRDYRDFVYSKVNYYSYFKENGIPILPTFTATTKEYQDDGHDATMKKVFDWLQREGIRRVIGKPVLGMSAVDVQIFNVTDRGRKQMSRYFRKVMKGYPGLVLQQLVRGFGMSKESPEIRMYFLGDSGEYKYSVSANAECVTSHPKAEGGTLDVPLEKLKAFTKNVIKKLPPIVMPNGARVPRLLTRLDLGYRVDGKYRPFPNEVEFSPSLYPSHKPNLPKMINYMKGYAKQMVKITKLYVKHGRTSGRKARSSVRAHAPQSRRVLKSHFLKHSPSADKR